VIDRSVELGGIYNMRDLGGFPGLDGRMVKTGMLYRASSLHRLDDEQAWGDFDAKCVIDLRYDRERDAFPLPAFITDYLDREGEAVLACVGCYRIEGLGAQLFTRIDGDQYVIRGLPLLALFGWLRERGELLA